MLALQLFCHTLKIDFNNLSKAEVTILEVDLFIMICAELKKIFYLQHKEYFNLMKFTTQMETDMIDSNFTKYIVQDLLRSGEYELSGLAFYLGVHEDIIMDVLDGKNENPSSVFLMKVVNLHRLARRDLYQSIVKKITSSLLCAA